MKTVKLQTHNIFYLDYQDEKTSRSVYMLRILQHYNHMYLNNSGVLKILLPSCVSH